MCGITGFIEKVQEQGREDGSPRGRLTTMLRTIEHRGPDDWGMEFFGMKVERETGDDGHVRWHRSPQTRVALGHRRLSILDLSADGRQPMTSHDGTSTITFNGEIYNYIEVRDELRQKGIVFHTGSDTEVLLEGYRYWGMDVLPRLDGMFAFAIWDSNKQKLICARDVFGIKPFYYGANAERFVFGSEPRAVLEGLKTPGHVDMVRLAEFLVLGVSDHDEGTFYLEVKQLKGGQWMEVDGSGQLGTRETYWHANQEPESNDSDTPRLIREQVELAVRRQLRSDVPVGACLSGGIDSASVVATAAGQLGAAARHFKALTLSNRAFDGDETEGARTIARKAGVEFHEVTVDVANLSDDLKRLVQIMGEPFSGLSMLAGYKVMQKAKALGLKVMLNGQGGDEAFLGYTRNARRILGDYRKQGNWTVLFREWIAMMSNMHQTPIHWIAGNYYSKSPKLAVWRGSQRIRGIASPFLLDLVRTDIAEDHIGNYSTHHTQVLDLTRYCLPRLLRFEDRNSMAFGLEMRVPMLSVPLVNAALRLPLRWRVHNGWTKYALRLAMADRLPEKITWNRRKRGFEVPADRWLKALRPRLGEWLLDLPPEIPINPTNILKRIDAGAGSSLWFWRCISTSLWFRFSGVKM
jgi:asparagine synthase (glutamine-hydrolysing)